MFVRFVIIVFSLFLFVGCSSVSRNARTIDDIDVSKKDGACIRQQCLKPYTSCVEEASKVIEQEREVDLLVGCKSVYRACTNTCPEDIMVTVEAFAKKLLRMVLF